MKRFICVSLFFLLSIILAIIYPDAIDKSKTETIETTTLAISGMIFTIMGVWIAFIYPNAILRIKDQKIKNIDFTENEIEKKRLASIVGAILLSLTASTGVLSIEIANSFLAISKHSIFQSLSSYFLLACALTQIISMWDVASANINFLNDLHTKSDARKAERQL